MMRNLWVLPAIFQLVVASKHEFSVQSDLLAFPQYEVVHSESYISVAEADQLLQASRHVLQHEPSSSEADSEDDGIAHAAMHDLQKPLRNPYSQKSHQGAGEGASDSSTSTTTESYERLILNSRPYLCSIPHVKTPDTETNTSDPLGSAEAAAKAAEEEEQKQRELARATDRGWELLKGMEGHCLYYSAGWWVYSLCYNEKNGIRQFHPLPPGRPGVPPIEDTAVQSYVLGRFDAEAVSGSGSAQIDGDSVVEADDLAGASKDSTVPQNDAKADDSVSKTKNSPSTQLATQNSQTYLVRHLTGGTTCDLTGLPRRISVQFHCNPQASEHINLIKETASCVYLMVIHTPRLCNDVAFMPPTKDLPNPISCREILDESSTSALRAWKQRKERHAEALLTGNTQVGAAPVHAEASPGPGQGFGGGSLGDDPQLYDGLKTDSPMIGGVILGAQKLVGGEQSRTIKASDILTKAAGGGKNERKFLALIAESDGKSTRVITAREIKNSGLSQKGVSRAEIDKIVADMEARYGSQAWRINLERNGRGEMEFTIAVVHEADMLPKGGDASDGEDGTKKAANKAANKADGDKVSAGETTGKKPDEKPGTGEQGDAGSEEEYK